MKTQPVSIGNFDGVYLKHEMNCLNKKCLGQFDEKRDWFSVHVVFLRESQKK